MKAYELLDSPEKWTKTSLARNARGLYCHPQSITAVCWCALGAIQRCYGGDGCLECNLICSKLANLIKREYADYYDSDDPDADGIINRWNDDFATYEEVIEFIKERLLKGE